MIIPKSEFKERYETTELGLNNLTVHPITELRHKAEDYLLALYIIGSHVEETLIGIQVPKIEGDRFGEVDFKKLEKFAQKGFENPKKLGIDLK